MNGTCDELLTGYLFLKHSVNLLIHAASTLSLSCLYYCSPQPACPSLALKHLVASYSALADALHGYVKCAMIAKKCKQYDITGSACFQELS